MPDIFISYAREDRETAALLAHALEEEGWSVWWDRHIPAGKRFDEVISASLDGAKCVIALWSKAAIASQWVAEEAEEGKERGVLVPALIEAVEPPLGFRRIHAADLIGWTGEPAHGGLRQLIGDICQLMSSPTAPTCAAAAAPTPPPRPLPPPTQQAHRRRWLPLIGGGVLLVALAVIGVWYATRPPAGTTGRKITVEYQSGGDVAGAALKTSIDGRWQGRVDYGWGPVVDEAFSFRTLGDALTGSAGFLGIARGITDAAVSGSQIKFNVRWREMLGSEGRDVVNHYLGTIAENRIDMVLTIDGGFSNHPPIEFALSRVHD